MAELAAATRPPAQQPAHQFDDLEQQHEAARLGMWAFLASEVMFFGGAIAAFAVYRFLEPHAFALASRHLDLPLGSINTVVLIGSSFTMALAVRAASLGARRTQVVGLLLTMLLGSAFLVVKGVEYHHKWVDHLVPGPYFDFEGPPAIARTAWIFFSFYFVLTGLHALHMVIGLVIVAIAAAKASRGAFTPEHHSMLEVTGLYWHFVDVMWIFLFPLLYLIGRHG